MHENDRSATGYLDQSAFEAAADAFFAEPEVSFKGWERAVEAQARVLAEVRAVLACPRAEAVVFVGHGGVGTLLYCALAGLPIARRHDQTGGGSYFAFDSVALRPHHGWRAIEELSI